MTRCLRLQVKRCFLITVYHLSNQITTKSLVSFIKIPAEPCKLQIQFSSIAKYIGDYLAYTSSDLAVSVFKREPAVPFKVNKLQEKQEVNVLQEL